MSPRLAPGEIGGQVMLGAGLVLLWMLLWGQFTWLSLLTGLILALGVSVVFYLPAVEMSIRINPWYTAVFLLRLLFDICRASVLVSWLVLKPRYEPSNAIMAIPLRTRSDLIMTWTAEAISIVPGSIVVDVDREVSVLYVHTIDVHDDAEMAAFEREVLMTEKRITLALGTKADIARVRAGEPASHGRGESEEDET
ncbi:multisubunit sodium/proton antiporter, MrpE subunit [Paramicrobacterium humi]|uniref:Multisubunit sodium/proton antiporter, MrpE subunit n=1 Tax=Paramicrobacterium humi TaxID=640635 RepID=A0A1H4IWZ2_9MICO|nr:Na+/H+ antiporter subunit E [Microbacterium humi]SEB38136.1 multisubunit sodium/proton antiporter, MrpE subunit [Microbacterium humi]